MESLYFVSEDDLIYLWRGDDADSTHKDQKVDFGGGNVHLVTTKGDWDKLLSEASKEGKTVIVNFSVSWCKPCRTVAPAYSELSEKYPSLVFLTVDVDELPEVCSSLEIRATPTFFFLRDGEQVDKLVGASKTDLQKKIAEISESVNQ
ncbi:Thioredoxin [Macleaya cordata]|uniref:Thioredoxin n=1 Tax=Macleaya cordata TaxID=56857 RepID=A0A200QTB2_MACCD|nr:Thioredoxin [Macleaya cordata]